MKHFSEMAKKLPGLANTPTTIEKLTENSGDEDADDNNMISSIIPGKEGGILTAVRIRPLNTREVGAHSRVVLSSPGFMSQGIQILNPVFFKSSTQTDKLRKLEEREFSFDHTFWSLEGGNGVDFDEYATQQDIYEKIGKPIIENALAGFNSSLFAYGQTGSGKTFTMMGHNASIATTSAENMVDSDDDSDIVRGDGDDSGIIPRLCQDLLEQVNLLKTEATKHAADMTLVAGEHVIEAYMRAAYYEIYNEKLYDLLAVDYEVPRKVREHATEGAYVEGLTYRLIQSYDDIQSILLAGQEKRQTAETKMNAESSRSHAIFVIQIAQKIEVRTSISASVTAASTSEETPGSVLTGKFLNGSPLKRLGYRGNVKSAAAAAAAATTPPRGRVAFNRQVIERNSKICLIDLAGSERVNTTGATGDRLKEATNINSSLSTLGDVIRKLSDKGKAKRDANNNKNSGCDGDPNIHIPYRNSLLTWVLKDSLGGNSKTAIVATVSPSESAYSESLSTLRYLERAKYVETNAVINENNSQDPYVKHLQHQLSAYKTKLNSALMKIRQQECEHKAALSELTEEVDKWKEQAQLVKHASSVVSMSETSFVGAVSLDADEDEGDLMKQQVSDDDLAVTLGSDIDSTSNGDGYGDSDCYDRYNSSCGDSSPRYENRRFSRSSSKRSVSESRGRTKEYFENECYDLQESLARCMAECNNLRNHLVEVEDLHGIEVDILTEEIQSLSSTSGRGIFGDTETTGHCGGAEETISILQVTVERLQMRLQAKDVDLLAAKTQAQEQLESNNQLIFNLEIEIEKLNQAQVDATSTREQLLGDFNNLAIDFARVSAEKDNQLGQQEIIIRDLKSEIEVLGELIACKDKLIESERAAIGSNKQDGDEAAACMQDTHEDEMNSMREVMNMYKQEIFDREETLRHLRILLDEANCSRQQESTGSSLLDVLDVVSQQTDSIADEGAIDRIDHWDDESKQLVNSATLIKTYKAQIHDLEALLIEEKTQRMSELDETRHQAMENMNVCEQEWEARVFLLQKDLQVLRDNNDVEMLNFRVQIAENAKEKAEAKLKCHEEAILKHEETEIEYENNISELKGLVQDSKSYVEKLTRDWKLKEAEWAETEDQFEKVIHTLTDEIEVLEVDLSAKHSCLELFESQLVAQENELKSAEVKHEEAIYALKVDVEVMQIYLTAKEENVDALQIQLTAKDIEIGKLREEKKLIEDDLTIELESFKLALAGKEKSHKELLDKLEEAIRNSGISDEDRDDMTSLIMEAEILKQDVSSKQRKILEHQQSITSLTEESGVLTSTMASKDEEIRRLTNVDIPRLRRELLAKETDFAETLKQGEDDRARLVEENKKLLEELEARRLLDATVPGKKSKFICF